MAPKSSAAEQPSSASELFAKAAQQYQSGQLRLAEQNFLAVLAANPGFADAEYGLALTLVAQDKAIEALGHFQRALALRPNFAEAFNNLAQTLFALAERGHAAEVIKRNPAIRRLAAEAKKTWPRRLPAAELFAEGGIAEAAKDSFLLFFLGSSRLRDAEIEQFLTGVRAAILQRAAEAPDEVPPPPILALYCALARQCFINEYVFSQTADEKELVASLRERTAQTLAAGGAAPVHLLAALAAYVPLNNLPAAETLLQKPWPPIFQALLIQQVQEPLIERQLREEMPRLTEIDDAVSLKVRAQYEENPYPRWVIASSPSKKMKIDDYLRAKFPHAAFKPLGKTQAFDLLVAGCGTGMLVAGMAQLLQGARVLAVDLSLASLGYAKRMCGMLGLSNIEFAQADIIKLPAIGRTFDAISTTGVLHHMADPIAAWRGLVSMLRPGGFMHVGLYSETARQEVSNAWRFIAEGGYGKSADEIRRCREDIFALPEGAPIRQATLSPDFYSLSDCRDLLFHEHELRLTLPQIKAFLAENDLAFIGWDSDESFLAKYGEAYPNDKAKINLDQWHVFEQKYPFVFAHMYKFWVQKRA
ncbi:MAG TPA: methyltransferase [Xanthobacteraceae bacterium]|nr:methyltransferase [Xanthobacteraceae bacterium]